MIFKKLYLVVLIILVSGLQLSAQDSTNVQNIPKDTLTRKLVSDNPKPGGIFAAPLFGLSIPIQKLNLNSTSAINFGIRIEYASIHIYPVVIGISVQTQNFKGSDNFKTMNLLDDFQTKVTSFGLGADILLNKYLKTSFTLPFLTIEGKYITVKRIILPDKTIPEIKPDDSLLGFSMGLGFTLYIFDVYGNYTFAKDYSNAALQLRFHIPVLKF